MRHAEQDALPGGIYRWLRRNERQFVSRNFDEVRFLLQRETGTQTYELRGRTKPFSTAIQFLPLKDTKLSCAWFSSAMDITSRPTEPNYMLFFRLQGSSEYTFHRRVFITSPSIGALLPGLQSTRVLTNENWHVFGTRFDPGALQRELSRMLGREIVRPLEFDPQVNFDNGGGRIVRRLLHRLYAEAGEHEFQFTDSDLGIWQLERSIVTVVLDGLKHNYSKFLNGPERGIAPWQVRIVEEFIRENAELPLSLGDLAVVGGVSARSLQETFRRHRGCTPMEFLRRVRLDRVRKDLASATNGTTVTQVAIRWGFLHLGRFAADYRVRFKEAPSSTLQQSLQAR